MELTKEQKRAVESDAQYIAILAGAGSGKTKTLTERICHLIKEKEIKPTEILALTFSVKAAQEMKKRIVNNIGNDAKGLMVKTFHSFGLDILRKYYNDFPSENTKFEIIDPSSKMMYVKNILRRHKSIIPPEDAINNISRIKNKIIQCDKDFEPIFENYNSELRNNNLVDLDDLIWLTVDLLKKDDCAKEYLHNRFKHILVKDILSKYKGMDVLTDLYSYYQSPYINVENGVLNLVTKELLPHSTEYRQSKITNCRYEPDADCPEFKAMVERILPNSEDRKEIQKAFGLCLAKQQLPAKKVLILLVGEKDTGKTTLLNIVTEILGDYARSVDNSLLMQSYKQKTVGPEMYDFRETLMVTTSETNENDKLDTGRIKGLTGNTTISIRNLYSSSMDKFQMIGVIFIDSNHKPYIPPKESATWDRLRLFPFTCPIKNKDSNLKAKLDAEKSGIFNWLLEGLEMVLQEKEIFETTNMIEFKDSYKKDMDITEQFLKDCIDGGKDESWRIPTTMLFITYQNWCKDNGFKSSIRNKFYEEINKLYQKKKSNIEYYLGLSFTELGHLYSRMSENTSQEFAEKKRKLLEEGNVLSYKDRRKVYYNKSIEWFYGVKEDTDRNSYIDYCSWCSGAGFIPIGINEFMAKIDFIKKEKVGVGYSPREVIENSKNIWDVYY